MFLFRFPSPFAGLLGFSQGAGFAALLCALQQSGSDLAPSPPVRFAILYGGFRTRAVAHQQFYQEKIPTPSLNCIGLQDTICPPSVNEHLSRSFTDAQIARFNHGHVLTKEQSEIEQIRGFILPRFARPGYCGTGT